MKPGDLVRVSGCFTKEKFIAGRTLVEIERILGFRAGRLAHGMVVVALMELPAMDQFELAAYSNVATHRFKTPTDLNIEKIKAEAKASWATSGFERVVKVLPGTAHDPAMNPDVQYPPGQGAPQWISKVKLAAKVVGAVSGYPEARYVAADAVRRF